MSVPSKTSSLGGESPDWNAHYAAGDTPWDMDAPSPPLMAFAREGILPVGRRVLIPGCGSGHEVRFLGELNYVAIGVDIAPLAVLKASQRITGIPNATVLCLDLLDPAATAELAPVDWAFDQTLFCALPPARRADWAAAVARLIQPGGEIWALAFRTENTDHPPYDSPAEVIESHLQHLGFQPLERRILNSESHPARKGRETLVRMRRSE